MRTIRAVSEVPSLASVFLWMAGLMCASIACSLVSGAPPADLVLTGGKVVTVDSQHPAAEAIAVRGERILAVGSVADIALLIGPQTRVIALDGQMVVPGLIEGHGHFLGLGESKMILDVSSAATWDEIVEQVAAAARGKPAGTWILGRGWHQSKWREVPQPSVEGTPTHEAVSRVAPAHPVVLTHASGHMCIANAQAMQLAGIDRHTQAPAGGEILHDAAGNLTGVLRENAMELIHRVYEQHQRQRSAEQNREDQLETIRAREKSVSATASPASAMRGQRFR